MGVSHIQEFVRLRTVLNIPCNHLFYIAIPTFPIALKCLDMFGTPLAFLIFTCDEVQKTLHLMLRNNCGT